MSKYCQQKKKGRIHKNYFYNFTDFCDFEPCLNNGTCSISPTFSCKCNSPYSGTNCEIHTQPCSLNITSSIVRKRKKRSLFGGLGKALTAISNIATSLVNNTLQTVTNVVGSLDDVVKGVVTLDIGKALSSLVNPLVDSLKGIVNDVVVNAVLKGLVEPIVKPLIPVVETLVTPVCGNE